MLLDFLCYNFLDLLRRHKFAGFLPLRDLLRHRFRNLGPVRFRVLVVRLDGVLQILCRNHVHGRVNMELHHVHVRKYDVH